MMWYTKVGVKEQGEGEVKLGDRLQTSCSDETVEPLREEATHVHR